MKRLCFLPAALVFLAAIAFSQPPDTLWTKMYDFGWRDQANDVRRLPDGGFVLVGNVEPGAYNVDDISVVRVDSLGNIIWMRHWGSGTQELGYAAALAPDTIIIISGSHRNHPNYNTVIGRIDLNGTWLWVHEYGGGAEGGKGCAVSLDGSVLMGGNQGVPDGSDLSLFKLTMEGDTIWRRLYSSASYEYATDFVLTDDSCAIFAAYVSGENAQLLKLRPDLFPSWRRYYNFGFSSAFYAVTQTSDGTYVAVGTVDHDILIAKIEPNHGDVLWFRRYGWSGPEIGLCVLELPNGDLAIGGFTQSFGNGGSDAFFLQTADDGTFKCIRLYGSSFDDCVNAIELTADSNCVLAGYYAVPGQYAITGDQYLLKIRPKHDTQPEGLGYVTLSDAGPPDWQYRVHYGNAELDTVIFTGFSPGTVGSVSGQAASFWQVMPGGDGNDGDSIIFFATAASLLDSVEALVLSHPSDSFRINWRAQGLYGSLPGPSIDLVSQHGAYPPSQWSLSSFPNPFNPSTTISFSLPREARARIAVFDLLGREVAVLADEMFTAGEHRIVFNGSSLSSGLYFARLQSGNMQATHKLLLMK